MSTLQPLNDLVVVRLDAPVPVSSLIVAPNPEDAPLRKGTVLRVGPGRYKLKDAGDPKSRRVYIPTSVKPGDRVVFFGAAAGTRKNRLPTYSLGEDEALIHEEDVLLVLDGDVKVEL